MNPATGAEQSCFHKKFSLLPEFEKRGRPVETAYYAPSGPVGQ